MKTLRVLCPFVIFLFTFAIDSVKGDDAGVLKYNNCDKIGKNPYFPKDLIIDKTWNLYRMWDRDLKLHCSDIPGLIFSDVTTEVKDAVRNNMEHRMKVQPDWSAESILMTTQDQERHKLLLFADQGIPGAFTGVLNASHDSLEKYPTLLTRMKLIEGKYLVVMDCSDRAMTAIYTLSGDTPSPTAIANLKNEFKLDEGHTECVL